MRATKVVALQGANKEAGFGLLESLLVAALIVILSAAAILSIGRARNSMRLQRSSHLFAQNVEKARIDAIKRHDLASVEFVSPTEYEVTMDFTGTGATSTTRRFTLEGGVQLVDDSGNPITTDPFPFADFDWRGRTSQCSMNFRLQNPNSVRSTVQIMGSGDVTVDSNISTPADVSYSNVNQTEDILPSSYVLGGNVRSVLSPCGSSTSTGGPPSAGGTGGCPTITCSSGCNTQPITIRRNGNSTATVTITANAATTITATAPSNLSVTPGTQTITNFSGGTASFTIASTNRTRGLFSVSLATNCATLVINVQVVN